jgi:hypothetical protein
MADSVGGEFVEGLKEGAETGKREAQKMATRPRGRESLALATVILSFVLWLAMREKLIPLLKLATEAGAK